MMEGLLVGMAAVQLVRLKLAGSVQLITQVSATLSAVTIVLIQERGEMTET
jgi:hypothetical protein